ncbi:integral membrane protein [Corynascus novoguineensis]|uniref:Integral membrane protein n=1 Tax=Corynascus novoguineensis TaxID=1126955 RepID=A0AAN7D4N3_9PEZI|nr:integral membrane protein [Corynascus novoguineensis]
MGETGTASGFDPNDNNARLVYIPSAVFVVICPVLMGLRIWARLIKGGKLTADDWTAVAALLFTLLTSGFLVASCQYGMGRHWVTIGPQDRFETNKYFFMAQVTYKAAINLVKCCILLLYLRIFYIVRWFRYSCWALLSIVAMYCAASILVTIFQCRPVIRAFDKDTPGTCIDTAKFWFANAGFSIATDIIILLLPMPLIWKLGAPKGQKYALMGVFAVGIFAVITSCLRVTTLDLFAKSPDNTYNIDNVMWTIVEPNVAVICACLPILRPLVVGLIPGLGSSRGYGGTYSARAYGTSKSRTNVTQRSQSKPDSTSARHDWMELGGVKSHGENLATIRRPSSHTGSEESILRGTPAPPKDPSAPGIQKTVEYSIQYSKDNE